MQLKLHARQICYTKLLSNKLNAYVTQTSNYKHDRNHSWQRGFLNSLFYEESHSPILPNLLLFKFCPPHFIVAFNPAILLNDIMDVQMSILRTLMHDLCIKASSFILCIGVSTPLQKHHLFFFVKQLLKSTNCPSPPFLCYSPLQIGFSSNFH